MIKLKIFIPQRNIIHLKDKSSYNYNFYKIKDCGDMFYGDLDIILEETDEEINCFTYSLGKFDNGEFKGVVHWVADEEVF